MTYFPADAVSSAALGFTAVFEMGTGVSPAPKSSPTKSDRPPLSDE